MKKVLTSILLMFLLVSSTGSSVPDVTKDKLKRYERVINHNIAKNEIYKNINKIDTLKYSSLDSLPILFPVKFTDFKYISSDYGMRIHPILNIYLRHKGIDIVSNNLTKIHSTGIGIVEKASYTNCGYGNEVIINHGNGYKTRYAHLSKIYVKEGDIVNPNNILGIIGRTGLTTGVHLHYEIIKDGKDIDPLFITYSNIKERSIDKYLNTMITLELS